MLLRKSHSLFKMYIRFFGLHAISLLCMFALIGCVGNQAYRRGNIFPNQLPPTIDRVGWDITDCTNLPKTSCLSDGKGGLEPQRFYLAYIEFDDMGELWSIGDLNRKGARSSNSESQLEAAVTTIRKAKQQAEAEKTELVVVTFVHGWKNNASAYDERKKNLAGFKKTLQVLSERPSLIDPNKRTIVVGIFIGWRGQVIAGNLFTSYWNRRDAANRVGGPSMTEAVSRLMFETKGAAPSPDPNDSCRSKITEPNSHFLIIGHSFGARVLEHAISQPILSILLERQSQAESCVLDWNREHPDRKIETVSFQAPADLIVFLNPANDAFETKATIEMFKRSHLYATRPDTDSAGDDDNGDLSFQGPLMISITSKGDRATGKLMPFAQTISVPGKAFRGYDKDACSLDELGDHNQRYYFRRNDGNVIEMRSHEVKYLNDVDDEEKCNQDWPYFSAEVSGHKRCFELVRLAEDPDARKYSNCRKGASASPWNDTPFYVMSVPSTLIANHDDIFQDGTVELLNTIVSHYATTPTINAPAPSPDQPLTKQAADTGKKE